MTEGVRARKSVTAVPRTSPTGRRRCASALITDASSSDSGSDRSHQMVDAAHELLDEKGLEGLTIRAVLKRTGLARRALYERFAGKDDLVLAVFEQTIRLTADHYAAQITALPDPMERLRLILVCLVLGKRSLEDSDRGQASRLGAAMSREHLRLAESRPGDLQAALRPLIELISRQLGEGMKSGQVRDSDPQRLATLVYNLVSTTAHARLLAQEVARRRRARRVRTAEDVRLAEDIWDFCRRAIAASAVSDLEK